MLEDSRLRARALNELSTASPPTIFSAHAQSINPSIPYLFLMENAPVIIINKSKHQWKTHTQTVESLGLTEERFASLHAIIQVNPDKEIIAANLARWLILESTLEDRRYTWTGQFVSPSWFSGLWHCGEL